LSATRNSRKDRVLVQAQSRGMPGGGRRGMGAEGRDGQGTPKALSAGWAGGSAAPFTCCNARGVHVARTLCMSEPPPRTVRPYRKPQNLLTLMHCISRTCPAYTTRMLGTLQSMDYPPVAGMATFLRLSSMSWRRLGALQGRRQGAALQWASSAAACEPCCCRL
jgi:hypothetical protein